MIEQVRLGGAVRAKPHPGANPHHRNGSLDQVESRREAARDKQDQSSEQRSQRVANEDTEAHAHGGVQEKHRQGAKHLASGPKPRRRLGGWLGQRPEMSRDEPEQDEAEPGGDEEPDPRCPQGRDLEQHEPVTSWVSRKDVFDRPLGPFGASVPAGEEEDDEGSETRGHEARRQAQRAGRVLCGADGDRVCDGFFRLPMHAAVLLRQRRVVARARLHAQLGCRGRVKTHVDFALAEVADIFIVGLLAHRRKEHHQRDGAQREPQEQRATQLAQLGEKAAQHHEPPVTSRKRCSSEVRSLSTDSG